MVVVELDDGRHPGRGEAGRVYYLGDNCAEHGRRAQRLRGAIEAWSSTVNSCSSCCRVAARAMRSTARSGNSRRGAPAAGVEARRPRRPKPLMTTITLGAEHPEVMAARATKHARARASSSNSRAIWIWTLHGCRRCAPRARTCGSAWMPTRVIPAMLAWADPRTAGGARVVARAAGATRPRERT